MSKLVLTELNNSPALPPGLTTIVNNNNQEIEDAIENTISRDGTAPNQMNADFDMNDNDILNVGTIQATNLTLDGVPISGSRPNGPFYPEWFGAVGDGVADDSAAIQLGINTLKDSGGGDFAFSPKSYNIGTSTITVPISVSIQAARGSKLRYSGTGVALDIYGNTIYGSRYMTLPEVLYAPGLLWNAGTDTTSIGVRLNACHHDTIRISEIRNFRRGLVLKALANSGDNIASGNCVQNTIHVGHIINCWRGIDFQYFPAGGGFNLAGVNQNTFLGGVIRIDGAYTTEADRAYLYMPDAENNVNTFVGVNLEGTAVVYSIYCGSQENLWLNCRFEGNPAGAVRFLATAINNTIIGGRTTSLSDGRFDTLVSDVGFANRYMWANILGSRYITLDFNSGLLLFGAGASKPDFPLSGFGTDRLQIGKSGVQGTRHYGWMREETFTQSTGTSLTAGHDHYILTHSSSTTITNITGGMPNNIEGLVSIIATTGNVTLSHTASPTSGQGRFVLKAGVDKVLSVKVPILFRTYDGNLYEV